MTDAFTTNFVPSTAGNAFWQLFTMLMGAGWTVKGSGDGLSSVNLAGNTFTNAGAAGAHGYSNNNAWIRLQDPGGVREFVISNDSTSAARITYSPSAKFTSGGTASVQPTAADQQTVWGSGTNAAPSYAGFLPNNVTSSGSKFQGGARGSAPYGFWFAAADVPAGATTMAFFMDPLTGASPNDSDPVVVCVSNGFGPSSVQGSCFGFMDVGKTSWQQITQLSYTGGGGAVVDAAGGALNPFDGQNDALGCLYYRLSSPGLGKKGWSTLFRYTTIPRINFLDWAGNLTWIVVGGYFTFWDGATTPTN
jgi:hypothetical protein